MWRRETRRRAGDGCSEPRGVVVADAVAVAAGIGDQRGGARRRRSPVGRGKAVMDTSLMECPRKRDE